MGIWEKDTEEKTTYLAELCVCVCVCACEVQGTGYMCRHQHHRKIIQIGNYYFMSSNLIHVCVCVCVCVCVHMYTFRLHLHLLRCSYCSSLSVHAYDPDNSSEPMGLTESMWLNGSD